MRRNSIVLGERYIEGNYNRIMAAGELHINNSDIKTLYLAGEVDTHHSAVHKFRGAGEVKADGVNFGNIKVAGQVSLQGVCKGDTFVVIGELSAEYLGQGKNPGCAL